MALSEKTYNVLNYTTSPVAITISRNESILIPSGSDDNPSAFPLTAAEIQFANNSSNAFKIGLLCFEEDDEKYLDDLCRIRNREDIMTNKEIEKIFTDFKLDEFQKVINITDSAYFNRIYGVFMGLKNAGLAMSQNIEQAMSLRYNELAHNIITTRIVLTKKDDVPDSQAQKIAELEAQVAKLSALVEKGDTTTEDTKTSNVVADDKVTKADSTPTKATKGRPKKTTTTAK